MNPNEIIPFSYEGSTVRTVDGNDGNTWFVAADVAKTEGGDVA